MSRNKLNKSNIGDRILSLCSEFSTDKEFLNKCNISNPAFISNIRKGTNKNPGAKFLAQIVRGTGCSGTWLLTGEGEKYEPRKNQSMAAEPGAGNFGVLEEDEVPYGLISHGFELLARIEQKAAGTSIYPLPADVELVLSRLLHTSLEHRNKGSDDD